MKSNVFEQIGFSPEEAASLKMKSELHSQIIKTIRSGDSDKRTCKSV